MTLPGAVPPLDAHEAEILALMQADEDDEAVYVEIIARRVFEARNRARC